MSTSLPTRVEIDDADGLRIVPILSDLPRRIPLFCVDCIYKSGTKIARCKQRRSSASLSKVTPFELILLTLAQENCCPVFNDGSEPEGPAFELEDFERSTLRMLYD